MHQRKPSRLQTTKQAKEAPCFQKKHGPSSAQQLTWRPRRPYALSSGSEPQKKRKPPWDAEVLGSQKKLNRSFFGGPFFWDMPTPKKIKLDPKEKEVTSRRARVGSIGFRGETNSSVSWLTLGLGSFF